MKDQNKMNIFKPKVCMLGEIADIVEMMPKARRKREFDIRNNYYL